MNTIIAIAITIAIVVAAILAYAATRPDHFVVQRSTSIKASPTKIFPLVNDFHQWGQWSPFDSKDPAMKQTFSGTASGKGAIYNWEGNNKVGMGRMEITDTSPPSKVTIQLDFIKPFEGHNIAEFTFVPNADSTTVTWAIRGPLPYMAKIMHLFLNMDRMIGKDFEIGLANLKSISER